MKKSWRPLCKTSWRCLKDVLKTFPKRLEEVLKTCWRRLKDVLKAPWRRFCKTSWRYLGKMSWRRIIKTNILVLIKTSWRRLLKTKTKDFFKTSSRRLHQDECLLGMYSFNQAFWLNLITPYTFCSTNSWFNPYFKAPKCIFSLH